MSKLANYKDVKYVISDKHDGNMSFFYGEKKDVIKNRRNFLDKNNLKIKNCTVVALAHKDNFEIVSKKQINQGTFDVESAIKADALITNEKNVVLFMVTADCLPIVLFDPVNQVISLVHHGWKGTNLKLVQKVLNTMTNEYHTKPENIIASFGPCIKKESYKFENPIQKNLIEWKPYLKDQADGLTTIDIVGYSSGQLLEMGVKKENIEVSNIDTAKNKNYFSHFRSGKTGEKEGRFATVISLI